MRRSALFASYFTAGIVFLVDLLLSVFRLSFNSGISSGLAIFVFFSLRLASKNPGDTSSATYSGSSGLSTIKEARHFSPANDFSGSYRLTS